MKTPRAWIISIGDEFVTGRRADANGVRIGRWLESLGCDVQQRCLTPDRVERIAGAVRCALEAGGDIIITLGGMGPTADDRTREGVGAGLAVELAFDEEAFAGICKPYPERGRESPEGARRQALRPVGSEPIHNPIGAAPGFIFERKGAFVIALPGVPRELEAMLERTVLPRLQSALAGAQVMRTAVLRSVGLSEAEVDRRLAEALALHQGVRVALLAARGEVEALLSAWADGAEEAEARLARAVAAASAQLGDHVYGRESDTLIGVLRELLTSRGWTLGVAESITGGLLTKRIVDLPGASQFFVGSVTPYADDRKPGLLDVPADLLARCGSISAGVARAMAEGVRRRTGADVALATTGLAGPDGGTADKPVGLTYVAVAWPEGAAVQRYLFAGDRAAIRSLAATTALDQARRALARLPLLGAPADLEDGECQH